MTLRSLPFEAKMKIKLLISRYPMNRTLSYIINAIIEFKFRRELLPNGPPFLAHATL
jgi:hypothetical protein